MSLVLRAIMNGGGEEGNLPSANTLLMVNCLHGPLRLARPCEKNYHGQLSDNAGDEYYTRYRQNCETTSKIEKHTRSN